MMFTKRLTVFLLIVCCATASQANEPPDPVAEFNALLGEPPANEDNVFVGLIEACEQVDDWDAKHRAALFTKLGLDPQAKPQGPRLAVLPKELQDAFDAAHDGPWTDEQHPHLAAWLDAQKPAMKRIEAVLYRPHYYVPLIMTEESAGLFDLLLPQLGNYRTIAKIWVVWTNRYIEQNDAEAAWQCVMSMRKLAEHIESEPTLIAGLVSISIYNLHLESSALVRGHALTDALLLQKIAETSQIIPTIQIADRYDQGERLIILDLLRIIHDGNNEAVQTIFGDENLAQTMVDYFTNPAFNLSQGNQNIHTIFDKLIKAVQLKNYHASMAAIEIFEQHIQTCNDHGHQFLAQGANDALKLQEPERSNVYTQGLMDFFLGMFMPAYGSAVSVKHEFLMKWEVQTVATAATRYRLDHGHAPKALDALVPVYLDALPADRFTGKALRYLHEKESTKIYSIGPDQQDNGGDATNRNDIVAQIDWTVANAP